MVREHMLSILSDVDERKVQRIRSELRGRRLASGGLPSTVDNLAKKP